MGAVEILHHGLRSPNKVGVSRSDRLPEGQRTVKKGGFFKLQSFSISHCDLLRFSRGVRLFPPPKSSISIAIICRDGIFCAQIVDGDVRNIAVPSILPAIAPILRYPRNHHSR